MVHLPYLTLLVFLLYLWDLEASSSKNVWKYKVQEPKTSQMSTYRITMNLSTSIHVCDLKFLSLALGSKSTARMIWTDKIVSLASELIPSDLRIGGSSADFLQFSPNGIMNQTDEQVGSELDELDSGRDFPTQEQFQNFTLTGKQWESFMEGVSKIGWNVLFDLNLFYWRSDGLWDSTNAEVFLNYSASKGIPIRYFQLGNEPNLFWSNFNVNITPETLVEDYTILKNVLSKYPLYKKSKLYGPDVTNIRKKGSARQYFQRFINAGAYTVVDEYSAHHYYCDGRIAKLKDFMDVVTLDSLKRVLNAADTIIKDSPTQLPLRLTETSSCFGGGARGLSDRYVGGFMWLDKLGVCAQNRISRVFRQTFYGGAAYSLILGDPTPDYYLSVLFKRLIEGPVFNISISPSNQKLRVYAHCARSGLYSPGALTIYYLNLDNASTVLSLTQYEEYDLDLYLLTPGDSEGLTSKFVKLNGNILSMTGTQVPSMNPKKHKGDITVTAQSFGFIVVPHAGVNLCNRLRPSSISSQIAEDRALLIAAAVLLLFL